LELTGIQYFSYKLRKNNVINEEILRNKSVRLGKGREQGRVKGAVTVEGQGGHVLLG
jgi:hypothetical protein